VVAIHVHEVAGPNGSGSARLTLRSDWRLPSRPNHLKAGNRGILPVKFQAIAAEPGARVLGHLKVEALRGPTLQVPEESTEIPSV